MEEQGEAANPVCRRSSSPAPNKSPVFYRLIVPSVIQEKKLRIPENFIKKLGSELPSVATLTTPNGCAWQVGLKKIEEKVWFTDGWHEFVAHQSIRAGYLLVFVYTENSKFKVTMYDLANAEVKYKCDSLTSSCPVPDKEDDKSSDSVELLDDSPRHQMLQKRKSSPSPESLGVKESELKRAANERNRAIGSAKRGTRVQTPRTNPRREATTNSTTQADIESALNASKAFKSENPFCRIVMRPSYFIKGVSLHIPASFAAKYLEGVSDFITLKISEAEKWTVLCTWRDGSAKFGKGWFEFIWDNMLKEGDVCIFELIDTEKVVFKVNIFRVSEDAETAKQRAMDLLFGQNEGD